MEKKEVEIGNPMTIRGVTLIPVAELSLKYWRGGDCFAYFGIKQVVSIVVVSSSGKQAFRASGEEVPFDQFIQETPGIREMLETS